MIDQDHDLFIAIDVQNDFCPGGALAVQDGDAVVPVINRVSQLFNHQVMSQDWHPPGHKSFGSTHPEHQVFDTVETHYGHQTLWPDHCVQGTPGADFHADLNVDAAEMIVRKGHNPTIDSYSAFFENDHTTPTGLNGYMRDRGFTRLYVAGLAFDYCVQFTALDSAKLGFETIVIADACRSIDLDGSHDAATTAMRDAGVSLKNAEAIG